MSSAVAEERTAKEAFSSSAEAVVRLRGSIPAGWKGVSIIHWRILRARFRKLSNIVNIRFIQQFINALVYAALVQKLVKRVGVAKPFGTETPIPERLVIISPREAFYPNPLYIIHHELCQKHRHNIAIVGHRTILL